MMSKLLSFLSHYINNLLLITLFVVLIYFLVFIDKPTFLDNQEKKIKVYVCGEVERPGVYEVPVGTRIEDVLGLARVKSNADLQSINLAKRLRDEDMIRVYPVKKQNVKININTASVEELSKLPSISYRTANEIVEYREKYGNFTNINELLRIKSINVEDLEQIKDYIEF